MRTRVACGPGLVLLALLVPASAQIAIDTCDPGESAERAYQSCRRQGGNCFDCADVCADRCASRDESCGWDWLERLISEFTCIEQMLGCPTPAPGAAVGDRVARYATLRLLSQWGGPGDCDFDESGSVDQDDLVALLAIGPVGGSFGLRRSMPPGPSR